MDEKFFINIGRQLGSGGRIIGKKLASELNISFYDKELIRIASQESGLGKEIFEQADEKESHSLLGGLFGLRTSLIDEINVNNYLCNETLFKIQSDVIRELAEQKSCLFVGRCADYVLHENPRCVNVFISANIEDRVKRIAEIQQLSESKAKDFIEKMDKKRAGYYNYYSNKVWGAAESYHICINSSALGIKGTVTLIQQFVKQKFGF
ncbi:AAA family ATPase [Lutibacter sp. B1]|uniref:cytidylate kinase-like family protein n=1 Tax=Lutibacter sp. B1 TaxID=2725996 RepID=UPI001456F386|nr:cytidylate kinase-like family protein [Lutibacter sp. B1]NLP57059.1 cytidylate kinase-like family protein [Lutibacter sp. B1]